MPAKPPAPPAAPDGLRYAGNGAALLDTPARDLSAAECAAIDVAALLASGLYVIADAPTTPTPDAA